MEYKTINGIYLDLDYSEYSYTFNNLTFYFSSQLYLNKFKDNVENYVLLQQKIFEKSYRCSILDNSLFAIKYYKIVEKRGFRIDSNINGKIEKTNKYNITLVF